jgi:ethanolamine ammonia-lyase small subunit
MSRTELVTPDAWQKLRTQTTARIALGRAGGSLPTAEVLDFRASHAAARDAVWCDFQAEEVAAALAPIVGPTVVLSTQARDKREFLLNPDRGRSLDATSRTQLEQQSASAEQPDLALIIADGLSARAVHDHAAPLVELLWPGFQARGWRVAPVAVVRFGRVALQDEIGELLGARLALTILGERPGLRVPDSLGAYLEHSPRRGNTDANRNCISNIRPAGLPLADAAETILHLLSEADRLGISGVELKDLRPTSNVSNNRKADRTLARGG